jgi:hypothetical protein
MVTKHWNREWQAHALPLSLSYSVSECARCETIVRAGDAMLVSRA